MTNSTLIPIEAPGARDADLELLADARALQTALTEFARVIQFRDRDRACCYDVSVSQCYGLKAINEGGPLSVNDFAAHLYLEKSSASRLANSLEERGLIERVASPEDARSRLLRVTEDGRALAARIDADLTAEYAGLLEDFDPDVRAAMTRLVGRLGRAFASRVETGGGSCCVVR